MSDIRTKKVQVKATTGPAVLPDGRPLAAGEVADAHVPYGVEPLDWLPAGVLPTKAKPADLPTPDPAPVKAATLTKEP